jgi:hypothetical protein
MSFKSVSRFDPDEVVDAQGSVPREPDVFESACGADGERAARIPPDIRGQSVMIRSAQDDYTTGVQHGAGLNTERRVQGC